MRRLVAEIEPSGNILLIELGVSVGLTQLGIDGVRLFRLEVSSRGGSIDGDASTFGELAQVSFE